MRRSAGLIIVIFVLLLAAVVPWTGCGSGSPEARGLILDGLNTGLTGSSSRLRSRLGQRAVYFPAMAFLAGLQPGVRIGRIEIPRLGIYEWLVQGTSKEILGKGAGHIEGTSVPGLGGNFALAGDRVLYSAPFLRLDQLEPGDLAIMHMPYGDFCYRLESRTNVVPTEVSVLNPRGYDSLTLTTCDPPWDMQTRIVVSGRLESVETLAGAGPASRD